MRVVEDTRSSHLPIKRWIVAVHTRFASRSLQACWSGQYKDFIFFYFILTLTLIGEPCRTSQHRLVDSEIVLCVLHHRYHKADYLQKSSLIRYLVPATPACLQTSVCNPRTYCTDSCDYIGLLQDLQPTAVWVGLLYLCVFYKGTGRVPGSTLRLDLAPRERQTPTSREIFRLAS